MQARVSAALPPMPGALGALPTQRRRDAGLALIQSIPGPPKSWVRLPEQLRRGGGPCRLGMASDLSYLAPELPLFWFVAKLPLTGSPRSTKARLTALVYRLVDAGSVPLPDPRVVGKVHVRLLD
jgi:hypothetical protein